MNLKSHVAVRQVPLIKCPFCENVLEVHRIAQSPVENPDSGHLSNSWYVRQWECKDCAITIKRDRYAEKDYCNRTMKGT